MAKNSVRIRLKAYENRSLDAASEKIVKTATSHGAKKIVGPVPLPTEREVITVLRAVHKYKDCLLYTSMLFKSCTIVLFKG